MPATAAREAFEAAMDDDFNTARGIGAMFEAVRAINRTLDEAKDKPDADAAAEVRRAALDIGEMGDILGFLNEDAEAYFAAKKSATLEDSGIDEARIEALIQERADARKNKDFKRADEVRDELLAMNIAIEDRPEGTIWKVI